MILLLALLATPPEPIKGSRLMNFDYPAGALRRGEQGTARFRAEITSSGRVKSCVIVESSGSAELDKATCDLIRRGGRYRPARDDSGKPVDGSHESSMDWQIPGRR